MNALELKALESLLMYLDDEESDSGHRPTEDHILHAKQVVQKFAIERRLDTLNDELPPAEICPDGGAHEKETPPAAYEVASDPDAAASHRQQAQNNSSVPNLGSMVMKYRWAKETIGMAALDLQKAYEEFVFEKNQCDYPTRHIESAFKRLEEVRQAITPELTDEIPW